MSVRKLKYHEQKLLKKVDFLDWKRERSTHEGQVIRRFHIERKEDYYKYNSICGQVTQLVASLQRIPSESPVRQRLTQQLLDKLYDLGVVQRRNSLVQCNELSVSSFCRRRLPVVMVVMKMSETLKEAITLIEQGHVRVGPEVVTDPAYLVTRTMEDFVTWVDSSKIRGHIMRFNDRFDDYDLLGL